MDYFRNLPWICLSNAVVANETIVEQSSTFKILHGVFNSQISSDTSDEDIIYEVPKKKKKKKKKKNVSGEGNNRGKCVGSPDKLGDEVEHSLLNTKQHAAYLEVLLAMKSGTAYKLPPKFVEMKSLVDLEQRLFLECIQMKWRTAFEKHHILLDDVNKYVGNVWKCRLEDVNSYPRYYKQHKMIPFASISEKLQIEMAPLKVLLEMGLVPRLSLPKLNVTSRICTDYTKMYVRNTPTAKKNGILPKMPVSRDKTAALLAVRHEADVVISSSALKCIAENTTRAYEGNWQIPIVVKECCVKDDRTYQFKKVVFIDKKLPPKNITAAEKNAWYHKLAVKTFMCHAQNEESLRYPEVNCYEAEWNISHKTSTQTEQLCGNCESCLDMQCKRTRKECISHDDSDDDINALIIDENSDCETSSIVGCSSVNTNSSKTTHCTCGKNLYKFYKDYSSLLVKVNPSDIHDIGNFSDQTNLTYRLWKLHPEKKCREDLNESFLKHHNMYQEIKILIRCKMDACERDGEKVVPVSLSSKLDYQPEHGAEKVSLSSLAKEWISLFVRPESTLTRVRINAIDEEILMTEHVNVRELSQYASLEYKYPVKSRVLGSLYNVLSSLVAEKPGFYILSHNTCNGAFVGVLNNTTKNDYTYDLHEDYYSVNTESVEKNGIPPWTPIDSSIITPAFIECKRIPATFEPN